jgi:hypothetical protein
MGQKLERENTMDYVNETEIVETNTTTDDVPDDTYDSEVPVILFPEEITQTLVDLEAKLDYIVNVCNKLDSFLNGLTPMLGMLESMASPSQNGVSLMPDPMSLMRLAMGK